jgi:curved DNA-binding protein CbpA
MGNAQSEQTKSNISERDLIRLQEQNKIQQEIIKQQILQNKLNFSQDQLNNLRQNNVYNRNSSNPLLTNPQLQQEFMKNKRMQKQFLEMIVKQKNLHLEDSQYQHINQYLKNLKLEEEKELDEKKSYLYMNQSSQKFNSNKQTVDFGTTTQQKDKLIRDILIQKKEQEEKMKREQEKRRREYESKLSVNDDIDPYKILELSKNATLDEAKASYKRKARVYHPDKFGGDGRQFKIITMAFMKLIEKYKRQQQDKQFNTLKDESQRDMEKQLNESKRNSKMKQVNMSGNNFNDKLFNKIYDQNRLYNPNDEGYSNWSKDTEFDSDETPKLFSNEFNLNVFNSTFSNNKPKKSTQITNYREPQALLSLNKNCEKLGQGNIDDYSGESKSFKYTDYKKAHTETVLINPESVNYKEYTSVDDLEKERGKKLFLTKEEMEQIEINKMLEKQREEQRLQRLRTHDDKVFHNFEKINKMFLNR